jgi:hypothetical protein
MSLYLLHIEPRYRHAGHYLGFCQAERVDRRVNEHLAGGSKASPLILAQVSQFLPYGNYKYLMMKGL